MKNRWLALIFVVALIPMVLPLLVEPRSPINVFFQSRVWVVAGGVTILLTTLAWLGNRGRPISNPDKQLKMVGLFFMREMPLLVLF